MPTIRVEWRGKEIETLPDYLRPGLKAVFVGINPALSSVAAGHYYQGGLGKRFWNRLREHRIVQNLAAGTEDETAFAEGFGFTDVVKRPSTSADELDFEDYQYGRPIVLAKLQEMKPAVVCFVFKKAADILELPLMEAGISTFRCPGPYAARSDVVKGMEELRLLLKAPRSTCLGLSG